MIPQQRDLDPRRRFLLELRLRPGVLLSLGVLGGVFSRLWNRGQRRHTHALTYFFFQSVRRNKRGKGLCNSHFLLHKNSFFYSESCCSYTKEAEANLAKAIQASTCDLISYFFFLLVQQVRIKAAPNSEG